VIAFLEGVVERVAADRVTLRVGGFGLEAFATARTLARCAVGATVRLSTTLLVREDGWTLYAFDDDDARGIFALLLGVSGVGPKVALSLLTTLSLEQLAGAIAHGDAALLATAPGVGKRTAERLAVELKGKMPEPLARSASLQRTKPSPARDDAIAALLALGFRESAVHAAVADLQAADAAASAETLIRKALARLR
jgi:holliday junction DNA helicase RuvA